MEHVGEDIIEWVRLSLRIAGTAILVAELVEMVCGRVSGYGVHPSGVVVSDVPLADELPCMYNRKQEEQVTCFPDGRRGCADVRQAGLARTAQPGHPR
jgi:hypothetical protein